jgi:hypothetical protein
MRVWWVPLVLAGCVGDSDPPELLDFQPGDQSDLRGVADISAWAVYRDESDVRARMFVDAEFVGEGERRCGESSCQATVDWSTVAFAPGAHDLSVSLEDAAGNVTSATHKVFFDDVLTVTSMRVSNIVDESGTLEIEVYAFDDTDQMIGCAGSRHGLATVDNAGIEYDTEAVLILPTAQALGTVDVGARAFRLEVWEDDDAPVCPDILEPTLNNLVGRSPMYTVEQWGAMPLMMFDDVTKLGVAWDVRSCRASRPTRCRRRTTPPSTAARARAAARAG